MKLKDQIKYHFYVIINNKNIFDENTKESVENLIRRNTNISFNITSNYHNEFSSIRQWINSILTSIYIDERKYQNSKIIFIHQDVVVFEDFIEELEKMQSSISTKKTAVFGLAGIDSQNIQHKFMNDSGTFSFTQDYEPKVVDSVDEFLFGLDVNILLKYKLFLSEIGGWHAYAAEFSILFKKLNYETVMFPIYTEHNSVRVNNKGLTETHNQLFNLYNVELKTLVGKISYKSNLTKAKLKLYSIYVNNIKWKFKNDFIDKLKSVILDSFNISHNPQRVLQEFVKKYKDLDLIVLRKNKYLIKDKLNVKVRNTQIQFRIFENIESINLKNNNIIIGITTKIPNFKFIEKAALNIRNKDE